MPDAAPAFGEGLASTIGDERRRDFLFAEQGEEIRDAVGCRRICWRRELVESGPPGAAGSDGIGIVGVLAQSAPGGANIVAQRISVTGARLWSPTGKPACSAPGRQLQFGDVPGLLVMATGAAIATIMVWAFLPETKPAEYSLTDDTYAKLLTRLSERKFNGVTPDLRDNILHFYSNLAAPINTKKDQVKWQKVLSSLEELKSVTPVSTPPRPASN